MLHSIQQLTPSYQMIMETQIGDDSRPIGIEDSTSSHGLITGEDVDVVDQSFIQSRAESEVDCI